MLKAPEWGLVLGLLAVLAVIYLLDRQGGFFTERSFRTLIHNAAMFGVAKDMRVTTFHLVANARDDVLKRKQAGFLSHLRVKHDLKLEVSKFVSESVDWNGLAEREQLLLADAQTSGGLLFAVDRDAAPDLIDALGAHHTLAAALVGYTTADHPGRIAIH